MNPRWMRIMGYINVFFFGYMMVDFIITHSVWSLLIGALNLTAAIFAFRAYAGFRAHDE